MDFYNKGRETFKKVLKSSFLLLLKLSDDIIGREVDSFSPFPLPVVRVEEAF